MQGAAEWVLEKCTASLNSEGAIVPLSGEQRQDLIEIVTQMAERGLRTLCLSYTDFPAEGNPADFLEVSYDENLVAMSILGIKVLFTPADLPTAVFLRLSVLLADLAEPIIHLSSHSTRQPLEIWNNEPVCISVKFAVSQPRGCLQLLCAIFMVLSLSPRLLAAGSRAGRSAGGSGDVQEGRHHWCAIIYHMRAYA